MYILYKFNKNKVLEDKITAKYIPLCCRSLCCRGRNEKMIAYFKRFIATVAWRIMTFGSYKEYVVLSEDKMLIHRSVVCKKSYKFPFLQKNQLCIGPCYTNPSYRGKGIYGRVLLQIVEMHKDITDFYMIVHDCNTSSRRGVEKAGFEVAGEVIRKGPSFFGMWCRV